MATPVILPRQGQSVESCMFSEWHARVGDQVSKGDLLFSYETDKAAFDGESPEDGILLAVFAEPGDVVPVLETIAVVGKEGEDVDPYRPGSSAGDMKEEAGGETPSVPDTKTDSSREEKATGPAKAGSPKTGVVPAEEEAITGATAIGISPRARKTAERLKVNPEGLQGSGPHGRIIERDIIARSRELPKATPLARSISSKDHLDLPGTGSGPGGKVTAADLRKPAGVLSADGYRDEKISNIRKIIAGNMHASLQNTAQLTLHSSADARRIRMARSRVKQQMQEGKAPNITIHDMVCYATVQALTQFPEMNVHFLGDRIRYFDAIHLGFAVDTPRGLMVPTIRNANHLKLEGLSAQMKELAALAQEGHIDPELMKGATFTITNLGAFGIEMFTPVLNPPQIGILGVNTISLKPADMEGGGYGFIPSLGLSLTFDHRGIDGAPAARFLQEVRQQIEKFESDHI